MRSAEFEQVKLPGRAIGWRTAEHAIVTEPMCTPVQARLLRTLDVAIRWAADALGVSRSMVSVREAGPALAAGSEGIACNPAALAEAMTVAGRADDAQVWFLVCLTIDLLVSRDHGDRREHPRVDQSERSHAPVRRGDLAAARAWARLQVPERFLLVYLNDHFCRQAPTWPARTDRRQLMLDAFRVASDAGERLVGC